MGDTGNIVIIEDDVDDKKIFEDIVRDLGNINPIKWFVTTDEAFKYLKDTEESIFLIFCDINLPGKNGLELKKQIDGDSELRKKSIPFVFMSTTAAQKDVNEAYTKMTVQGFFKKGTDYKQMKVLLKTIFDYWQFSKHPNSK